jgi:cell division protein FtsI/penicillin-binding protein 2
VEKARENLKKMQMNVKNDAIQSLMSIIKRMDTDKDSQVEPHEVEEALEAVKKLPGVKVDAVKFRKAFSGSTVKSLMTVIGNINKHDALPEADRIFEFPPVE